MRWCLIVAVWLLMSSLGASSHEFDNDLSSKKTQPLLTSSGNTSGWFAQATGELWEVPRAITNLDDGGMIVFGSFGKNIRFDGNVEGFVSNDSDSGEDAFGGWISETGNWTHTKSWFSDGVDMITHAEEMSNGHIAVAGNFCGGTTGNECQMQLSDDIVLNKSTQDDENAIFYGVMDQSGEWIWANSLSSERALAIQNLIVTHNNSLHIATSYQGELDVYNTSIANGNLEQRMILVFNEFGEFEYVRTIASSQGIEGNSVMCEDGLGKTYFGLSFISSVIFEYLPESGNQSSNIAFAQYDADGWSWSTSAGSTSDDSVSDCEGLPSGGIRIAGNTRGQMNFSEIILPGAIWVDFYDATLSEYGEWTQASLSGGAGVETVFGIEMTSTGETLFTGTYSTSFSLGAHLLADFDTVNNPDLTDIFLAKKLANGTWDWAKGAGGVGHEIVMVFDLSSTGSPVMGIYSNHDGQYSSHFFDQRDEYDMGVWLFITDLDDDGVIDGEDNCPTLYNPDQSNHEGDPLGDACDLDDDNDSISDIDDDCPFGLSDWMSSTFNDHDQDGCEDESEDYDDDEDGIFDTQDLCPKGPVGWISTPEEDSDGDGCTDVDSDGDGLVDHIDNCPTNSNSNQADFDNDGIGDACDPDKDGDGISLPDDLCPHDLAHWTSTAINDYDRDGCIDISRDDDDDNDGVTDNLDNCHFSVGIFDGGNLTDRDGDGCIDATEDLDDDQDGLIDTLDHCPQGQIGKAAPGQDFDADGCIDVLEDDDDDADGVLDPLDDCPLTNKNDVVGSTGCSQYQLDDDGDGIVNAYDFCLNSQSGVIVDQQGCQVESAGDTNQGQTEGGNGLAIAIFIIALLLVAGAFFISRSDAPHARPPHQSTVQPPPRPQDLKEEE